MGGLKAVLARWGVGKLRTRRRGAEGSGGLGECFLEHTGLYSASILDGSSGHPNR